MLKIVQHTPAWVWGVLLLLLVLGFWQSRTRAVPRGALLLLPVMMPVFAVYGLVASFGWSAVALGGWLAGLLLPLGVLRFLPAMPGVHRREDGRIHVPGSRWPGVWMLAIFVIRYVLGAAAARHWPGMENVALVLPVAFALGMLGGLFVLRSVRILRAVSA
ncbi:MAG: hypothetical protein Q4D61_00390 [Cardiobacteriaceae bacterium]|nr:hypothetical protein [Cardiobacteriaceae bacterium]